MVGVGELVGVFVGGALGSSVFVGVAVLVGVDVLLGVGVGPVCPRLISYTLPSFSFGSEPLSTPRLTM